MRDIIIAAIVFGALPFILARPHVGVLVWSWLGYMNPHRLSYGFAYNFPFSMVVAMATLAAIVFSSEKKRMPWHPVVIIWLSFVVWMGVTTLFAFNEQAANAQWAQSMKIMLIVLVTMLAMNTPERVRSLVWIIVISLGFFGVKGGIFSILSGFQYRVWGPPDTFIEDNNTLALALVMVLPLMRFLHMTVTGKWLKRFLLASMGLTAISILTSYSRGALLAAGMMALFMAWNSRYRARAFIALLLIAPIMLSLMSDKWWDRMGTISSYDQDASTLGRFNAWNFAFNLAKDRPFVGGGFQTFTRELFYRYAPDPLDFHDAHSVYFEVLGEQGFVGLLLFLSLGVGTYFTGNWVMRRARERAELAWAHDLASMLKVSLVGYAVGGAFLGLAYYDLIYHLMALMMLTRMLVNDALVAEKATAEPTWPGLRPTL